jgi:catechol 2,3-dioxygenase-like lactoylglutathione lyase family enzyme
VKGIDHLVIRVSDLDASETAYRKLGFTLTQRGFHAGRGSANHTAPLSGGNYFELLLLPPGGDADAFPDREGPVAIALSPRDSRTIYAEVTALGYDVEPSRDLSRPVHLPEGVREARFLNASFPRISRATSSGGPSGKLTPMAPTASSRRSSCIPRPLDCARHIRSCSAKPSDTTPSV